MLGAVRAVGAAAAADIAAASPCVLYDAGSADKLAQTLLEMVRGGIADLPLDVTVFCETDDARSMRRSWPRCRSRCARWLRLSRRPTPRLPRRCSRTRFDYVMLFESSGMYNGEDIPWLASHLTGRLDAVWGSRRLSVRDIEESLRPAIPAQRGSRVIEPRRQPRLSLLYLALYGRYVSDTLSGARAVRVDDACSLSLPLTHKRANQDLLSRLLRRKAEMFEVPVHFFSVSPHQVKRTTVVDGLQSIGTILWSRVRRAPDRRRAHGRRRRGARPTPAAAPASASR